MNRFVSDIHYAKAWNDGIMQWKVEIEKHDDGIMITKSHGFFGRFTGYSEIRNGKFSTNDINKLMIKLISDKRNKGYRSIKDLDIINTNNLLNKLQQKLVKRKFDKDNIAKPMKAKPFKSGVMEYPAFIQPKINGVRCVSIMKIVNEGLFGKSTKLILRSNDGIEYNVPHIAKILSELYEVLDLTENTVFDGELYYKAPAPTIAGAAKNINNPVNAKLKYIIFDLAIPDLEQSERFRLLRTIKTAIGVDIPELEVLETKVINSDEEAIAKSEQYINRGYEGGIIRDTTAVYHFGGRRNNMLKVKKFKIEEFKVIDITLKNEGLKQGREQVLFVLKNNKDNQIFESVPTGKKDVQLDYFHMKNKYIGKSVKVKFYERTINNLPFHSNVIEVK